MDLDISEQKKVLEADTILISEQVWGGDESINLSSKKIYFLLYLPRFSRIESEINLNDYLRACKRGCCRRSEFDP